MRIAISFICENSQLTLPIHYNHIVQSFIYSSLDTMTAKFFHEQGYKFKKRRFTLFTFSKLLCKNRKILPTKKQIILKGDIILKIASINSNLLESFATYLVQQGNFRLKDNVCILKSIEVEMPPSLDAPYRVRAISPITTYSTVYTSEGKKKTYFYTPFENEFQTKLFENLKRKALAYLGDSIKLPNLDNAYIKPIKVSKNNEAIINFKGFWIKGWSGIYEIFLPQLYFDIAYNAGLGAKNSQGFGMLEIINNTNNKSL